MHKFTNAFTHLMDFEISKYVGTLNFDSSFPYGELYIVMCA